MAAHIVVLAGVNGSGKSSVAGAALSSQGVAFFNPDLHTQLLLRDAPGLSAEEANGRAWAEGVAGLREALAKELNYAFETTLGGDTITDVLIEGAKQGARIDMLYVGLDSVELNIARVRSRVELGGHDIPIAQIETRFTRSPWNLVRLLPFLGELKVFDNSFEADPAAGDAPVPVLLMHIARRRIVHQVALQDRAHWAWPILQAGQRVCEA